MACLSSALLIFTDRWRRSAIFNLRHEGFSRAPNCRCRSWAVCLLPAEDAWFVAMTGSPEKEAALIADGELSAVLAVVEVFGDELVYSCQVGCVALNVEEDRKGNAAYGTLGSECFVKHPI